MKLIIVAENERLLQQLTQRVARYNFHPLLTVPTLEFVVEEELGDFYELVFLVGAETERGINDAIRFAKQKTLGLQMWGCLFCVPHIDDALLRPLHRHAQCRVVRWSDSDEQWLDTLQVSQHPYSAVPEDVYRRSNPNFFDNIAPRQPKPWNGSEPIRIVIQELMAGVNGFYEEAFAAKEQFHLLAVCTDVERSYQHILDYQPHVLICDPACVISRDRDTGIVGYQPHHDFPALLHVCPALRIWVIHEAPRLSLVRMVGTGEVTACLDKALMTHTILQDWVTSTAQGTRRLSTDAQAVMQTYLHQE